MSKFLALVFVIFLLVSACDLRSETAKKEMEKFTSAPTPAFSPGLTPTPIDPRDSIAVDESTEGKTIHVNRSKSTKMEMCSKFDRVMINGDDNEVTIGGACRQVMINGDRNKISVEAAAEFIFNGSENILFYAAFVNKKLPVVVENRPGNIVERRVN